MSYIPMRDTFALPEATQTAIFRLIERMEVEERAELHKDQCMCAGGPDACLSALRLARTPIRHNSARWRVGSVQECRGYCSAARNGRARAGIVRLVNLDDKGWNVAGWHVDADADLTEGAQS